MWQQPDQLVVSEHPGRHACRLDAIGTSGFHGHFVGCGIFDSGLTQIKLGYGRCPTMFPTHRIAMTLFRTSGHKRRFALALLVLWLFALGAAWANACLLQDRTTHLDPSLVATAESPVVSPGHIGVLASHAQNLPPGEAPCLKLCDDASQSLVKWPTGMELPDVAMPPPFAMAWSESVAALDARRPVRIERPARQDLPLRTRYRRLAL